MEYENIYRVVSLLTNVEEEKYANELIESGWELLKIVQFKDDHNSYGKYVLGANKETFEKNNIELIEKRVKQEYVDKYGF